MTSSINPNISWIIHTVDETGKTKFCINIRHMYKIVLACYGVPPVTAPKAASYITTEFTEHRNWHKNVSCRWDGSKLILQAENDFDSNGLALMDEFSDCISAYISEPFDGEIKVEVVSEP